MFRSLTLALALLQLSSAVTTKEGKDWLAENALKPGVVSLPSGLQYKVLVPGAGMYHPKADTLILAHYEGRLTDGTVFDSTGGGPQAFTPNHHVKGWSEALTHYMVEGDKYELYMPSELAYGEKQNGKVPGGSVVIVEMELVNIARDGAKVRALKCNVETGGGCDNQEQAFVKELQGKKPKKLQKELKKVMKEGKKEMTPEEKEWQRLRIHILNQMLPHDMKEELKEEEL